MELVLTNPQVDPTDLWRQIWALERRIRALETAYNRDCAALLDEADTATGSKPPPVDLG